MKWLNNILCKIGMHKWTKPKGFDQYSSNVVDYSQHCSNCGKTKRWVVAKTNKDD